MPDSSHNSRVEGEKFSEVPLKARIMLSHAHLQQLAEKYSVDLLHIKGYIFGEDTYPSNRTSTDVDVLVRPEHVQVFIDAVTGAGWEILTTFETGSDYHHAMTIYHPTWGLADIHRAFPGLGTDAYKSFEQLWHYRRTKIIASYPCYTTSLVDSRIIVYVHDARSTSPNKSDVTYLEQILSEEDKTQLQARVVDLDAELAYAASIGKIDDYVNHADYLLWKTASQQSSNITRWYARIQSASGLRAKIKTLNDIFRVNRDHLAMELGHKPSQQEVWAKFIARFWQLLPQSPRRRK